MGKRIMVVDDSAFLRMMIKNMVTKHGFEIVGEAENGEVAVTKYKQLKPDLVTMDITMPDMTGIEAVKAIHAVDPKANIIMCSAMGQKAMVIDAIKAGAKDFIVKPFQEEKVMQSIKKVLNIKDSEAPVEAATEETAVSATVAPGTTELKEEN